MTVTEQAVIELLLKAASFDSEVKDSQDRFVRAVDRMQQAAKRIDFDPASEEARELRGEVERTGAEFVEAADKQKRAWRSAGVESDRLEKEINQTRGALARFNREGQKGIGATTNRLTALRSAAIQLGTVFGGISIAFLTQAAFRQLASFQDRMAEVRAVTGATADEMRAMEDQAKDLGATTSFSASQAAEGMAFLGRAGFETGEVLSAMPGLLDLAASGMLDLGRAADIASNIVTGFGLEASETSRVADVLAAAAASANTNVEQMGQAMKFVAPIAAGLGVSVEEAAAAIGVLSNAGIQAEMAGTSLRNVLVRLTGAAGETGSVFEELGLDMADLNPQTASLTEILDKLAAAGVDVTQAMEAMQLRGGPALQVLIENRDEVASLTKRLQEAEGAAEDMAKVMLDTLSGDLKILRSVLESTTLSVGDEGLAGVLRDATQGLTGLVRAVNTVIGPVSNVIKVLDASIGGFIARAQAAFADMGRRIFETLSRLPGRLGEVYEQVAADQVALIAQFRQKANEEAFRLADALAALGGAASESVGEAISAVQRLGLAMRKSALEVEEGAEGSSAALELAASQAQSFLNALSLLPAEAKGRFSELREEALALVEAFKALEDSDDPAPTIRGVGEEAGKAKPEVDALAQALNELNAAAAADPTARQAEGNAEAARRAEELAGQQEKLAERQAELADKTVLTVDEVAELSRVEQELNDVEIERARALADQADAYEVVGDASGLFADKLREIIERQREAADAGQSFLGSMDPDAVGSMNEAVATAEGAFAGLGEKVGLGAGQLIDYTEQGAKPAAEQTERAVDALRAGQDEFNALGVAAAEAGKEAADGAEKVADASEDAEKGLEAQARLMERIVTLSRENNRQLDATMEKLPLIVEACREWQRCLAEGR